MENIVKIRLIKNNSVVRNVTRNAARTLVGKRWEYHPDQEFEATETKKKPVEVAGNKTVTPPAPVEISPELIEEYTILKGKKPDGRWTAERLQKEIDKLKA